MVQSDEDLVNTIGGYKQYFFFGQRLTLPILGSPKHFWS